MDAMEIPSDGESEDGWESDSSDLEIHLENGIVGESVLCESLYLDEDTPLADRLRNLDGIWEAKSRPQYMPPFTSHVGPKNIPEGTKRPIDFFLLLLSDELIDKMVTETNLYCSQSNRNFDPVTKKEISTFLGLTMLMGIKRQAAYRDYWSSNIQLHDKYICSFMDFKRYSFLSSHFHLNDNSREPKKGHESYDKLYKIRPFIDTLSENYKRFYDPTRVQAIDESMIKFKGRSSFKQYMPKKPNPRGFKAWVRADKVGYTCEFQIYTGKVNGKSEKCLGSRVVRDLSAGLAGKNYEIYFDNYFSSVELMAELREAKILACATVRKDRVDLPKKIRKNLTASEYEYKTSYKGLTWVQWCDKRIVSFLSNFHDPAVTDTVDRKQKDGSSMTMNCPALVKDYNHHMGCVDKADQNKSAYNIDRRSKKWWHRIFWHFIDVTVVNAFIIYKQSQPDPGMTLKSFRLSVVDGLVQSPNRKRKGKPPSDLSIPAAKIRVPLEMRQSDSRHMPVWHANRRRCGVCSTKAAEVRTNFTCETCQVPLCIGQVNCFRDFHNRK